MAVVRTILWVVLAVVLVLFAVYNWQPVVVRISNALVLETKLPALVIGAFLLGLVPMWLLHRASLWRQRKRIANLEATAARPATIAVPAPPPEPPA